MKIKHSINELQKIINDINNGTKEILIKFDIIATDIFYYPYKLSIQNKNSEATKGYLTWTNDRVIHFKTLETLEAVIATLKLLATFNGIK